MDCRAVHDTIGPTPDDAGPRGWGVSADGRCAMRARPLELLELATQLLDLVLLLLDHPLVMLDQLPVLAVVRCDLRPAAVVARPGGGLQVRGVVEQLPDLRARQDVMAGRFAGPASVRH